MSPVENEALGRLASQGRADVASTPSSARKPAQSRDRGAGDASVPAAPDRLGAYSTGACAGTGELLG
jgi:hypothetical protein